MITFTVARKWDGWESMWVKMGECLKQLWTWYVRQWTNTIMLLWNDIDAVKIWLNRTQRRPEIWWIFASLQLITIHQISNNGMRWHRLGITTTTETSFSPKSWRVVGSEGAVGAFLPSFRISRGHPPHSRPIRGIQGRVMVSSLPGSKQWPLTKGASVYLSTSSYWQPIVLWQPAERCCR